MNHFYKKIVLIALVFITASSSLWAQEGTWKRLGKVTFKKEYDELMGFNVDKPVFSKDVQSMNGKEVTIKGYIIPTNGYKGQTEFVFSAFPYNMCFFCGGAGPESVMEVEAAVSIPYTTEPIVLKGVLHLNGNDINRLMYNISGARKVD
jgi:hypothetical protein